MVHRKNAPVALVVTATSSSDVGQGMIAIVPVEAVVKSVEGSVGREADIGVAPGRRFWRGVVNSWRAGCDLHFHGPTCAFGHHGGRGPAVVARGPLPPFGSFPTPRLGPCRDGRPAPPRTLAS